MAITTIDQLVAGLPLRPPEEYFKIGATMEAVGITYSPFYVAGRPGAAVAPTPGLNGAHLTTYLGQLPFTNPAAGNSYLSRFCMNSTVAGSAMLVDRLWHNSSITITQTTNQAITFGTLAARDANGATLGDGVMCGIEVSTVTGNAGAITNTTLTYTNQAGTGSKTATMASFPITALAGTFVPFQLAAGDTGIRSIEGLTLGTSYVSGTIHLVCYRVLARVGCPAPNVSVGVDSVTSGMPRLYNNTVPMVLWVAAATTAVTFRGQYAYSQG